MAKNSLATRLLNSSTVKMADSLNDSKIYQQKDVISTPVPGINIAFSGSPFGGISPGITVFAGPSKHFKTMYALICAASYLKKYDDAVVLFYDAEFGSPVDYFVSAGIDPTRVIHVPIMDWEVLIHDAAVQMENINRGDHVIVIVDSIGNLPSKKEKQDAIDGSEKADMTRAKRAKSFFRIVTPYLRVNDIPMIVISHTYDTQEMYSKKVVSGGTGAYYSADNIFIVGREQEKEGSGTKKELTGYQFKINIEKSRSVREKSMIPITVKFEGGVERYSGLFDIAMDIGMIVKVASSKSYNLISPETGEVDSKYEMFSRNDVETNSTFWKYVLMETEFDKLCRHHFRVSSSTLISDDPDEANEVDEVEDMDEIE